MELFKSTSRRGFSVRGMLAFALTVIMTALLWATFTPGTTHAADPLVAVWKGDTILYDGHQYSPAAPAETVNSLGFPQGTHYYVYTAEPTQNSPTQKAFVIYFSPGTDPPTEKTATLATYTYSADTKLFSSPVDKQSINITVKGKESTYSSCTVEGIGWILCPVSVFLADSMDNIFKLISGFFVVQPVTVGDSHNSLYVAWNIMRSIANLAFIIVFLIIIYSQLVNAGISNYGLKKLLPRLIVAAILVNLSYLICSLAVDVSNILGYSIQDIFVQIRKDTFNITNDSWSSTATTWTGITTAVLSGGALIGAKVALGGGTFAGALPILLPILVGVTLTCLFVLLILAARQAIIVILIVIAPLAFVAYLLPNTEKWFEKWRELFMTMLVFFPAFSLVFGGSQLAGGLIIQNPNNSPIAVIFGLAVQVAPLIITPLLLKLSGGLLGKIAGLVNNPRNGIMDRSKKWSSDRIERNRLNSLRKPGGLNPFRRLSQTLDNSGQKVKKRTALYSAMNENRFNDTDANEKLHTSEASVNLEKERIENKLKAHTQRAINTRGTYLNIQSIQVEAGKVEMEKLTETTNRINAEYRAGGYNTGGNTRLDALQKSMAARVIETAAQKQGQLSAQYEQQRIISTELSNDSSVFLDIAQGIGGSGARIRARSNALAALSKLESEALENNVKLISEVALSKGKTLKQYSNSLALAAIDGDTSISETDLAAAFQAQAAEKNMTLFEKARGSKFINQQLLSKIIVTNAGGFKEAGGYHLQDDLELNVDVLGQTGFARQLAAKRVETLGNVAATGLDKLKFGWVAEFAANAQENISAASPADLRKAYNNARNALTNPVILATLGDRENEVRIIEAALARKHGQEPIIDPRTF